MQRFIICLEISPPFMPTPKKPQMMDLQGELHGTLSAKEGFAPSRLLDPSPLQSRQALHHQMSHNEKGRQNGAEIVFVFILI